MMGPDRDPEEGVALLEIYSLGATLVIIDQIEKAAQVRLWQAELNDAYGMAVKMLGDADSLLTAVATAKRVAETLHASISCSVHHAPHSESWAGIQSELEYQPLIEQKVVFEPVSRSSFTHTTMNDEQKAIGLIETQGFTAVYAAVDAACKAADVEVVGKEKLGGGYITVIVRGDVAAVSAAVDAGREVAEQLGTVIATHVIARPSEGVLGLLP